MIPASQHARTAPMPTEPVAMPTGEPTLMQRLKSSTSEAHDAAESHPFHRAMATGQVKREAYATYLGQILCVHRMLDEALAAAAKSTPAIARAWRDEHHNVSNLMQDLGAMGVCPAHVKPMPAAAAFGQRIGELAREKPIALLGLHYVMEGSKNGGKFISKVIQRTLGLQGREGTAYMDPYGDRQRDVWSRFRLDIDACDISAEDQERIISAAGEMFKAVAAVGDDVNAAHKA